MGIVIDNSGSMREKRATVNEAVLDLIRASNPADEIFVVNFGTDFYLDQDFTSDTNLLRRALQRVSASGTTALYDAVVASDQHLTRAARLSKKVLLVITDGQDNASQETLREAVARLQQDKRGVASLVHQFCWQSKIGSKAKTGAPAGADQHKKWAVVRAKRRRTREH